MIHIFKSIRAHPILGEAKIVYAVERNIALATSLHKLIMSSYGITDVEMYRESGSDIDGYLSTNESKLQLRELMMIEFRHRNIKIHDLMILYDNNTGEPHLKQYCDLINDLSECFLRSILELTPTGKLRWTGKVNGSRDDIMLAFAIAVFVARDVELRELTLARSSMIGQR